MAHLAIVAIGWMVFPCQLAAVALDMWVGNRLAVWYGHMWL